MSATHNTPTQPCLFAGQSGDTVELIRRFDWAASALGPLQQWPDVLISSTRLILSSPAPIVLLCGEHGVLIYNDAYAAFAGQRHPGIFGQPAEEAWPEIAGWNRHVISMGLSGRSMCQENLHLPLCRPGLQEDAWMNLYYNPLLDNAGRSHGMMCIVVETTNQIVAIEQRNQAEAELRSANERIELAPDGSLLHFPGVLMDIDERKRTELALRQLTQTLEERVSEAMLQRVQTEEQLRQAQKMEAIGQLTGGIAHDFNNLLAGILGILELIQRKLPGNEHPQLACFVDAAIASANRGASLTHRLLAFARRQSLDMRPVEVNALVRALEELLVRTLGERISLETRLADDLWPTRSDDHQLENALLNLAINARDAMPDGGRLRIETRNTQLGEFEAQNHQVPAGDYLLLSVSDTGCGMPEEIIRHAFEPFFTTKPIGQGTGLGLSMVYGFVKQTGGYLHLHSQVGRGTTLNLYLPRLPVVPAELPPGTTPEAPHGTGERILVVEDDKVVRMLMVEVLEELGYSLIQASDAQSALGLLEQHAPLDLLLTDVGLPGMNGRQLADAARQRQPGLKVLFATGYAEGAELRHGYLGKDMDMIAKPFSFEALAGKIKAMLGD